MRWFYKDKVDDFLYQHFESSRIQGCATPFPNILKVLQILAICPVTTAGVERGNSMLKLIKTAMRSTIGPDNLNAFCKMRWFYKEKVDVDEVIRKWS
eukprot:CAMPEP_0194674928 /NCGR_PEP_ID=MMETSP0295-20121207/7963_1 /TAXON_ID=39354 /ORGANISM="Heterosigma akashiwo, Strain CCMP2393" /LENGTH=96 /DNA_ID=CAMNT_0039559183 /DNA_START=528 /DNA_END=815 /DNA_ORIENTATION=+